MGLFEIHCHTSEVSACAWVDAVSVARIHKNAGFAGICITDHFHKEYFESSTGLSASQVIDKYLSGYRLAAEEGKRIGLKVFLGMEIKFPESANDYLVYGITEDFLYENPYMFNLGIERFSEMARNEGLLLIQAHPFRDNMTRINPIFLDGVESLNANIRINSRNEISENYADENDLIKIGGSDFHRECDVNLAAMEIFVDIDSNANLVNAIRNGDYAIVSEPFN